MNNRAVAVEAAGTALLLAAVVGSGIMAERLAGGNVALALLANAVATGCVLVALIAAFADISGAHFNPVVTCAAAARGHFDWKEAPSYLVAQMVGAICGVFLAHAMFDMPLWQLSEKARFSAGQVLSEVVATFGLVVLVLSGARTKTAGMPFFVAAYITAAYWFTASTSFANPAVTIARSMTDSFAGIAPNHVPAFIGAQAAGAGLAVVFDCYLNRKP